MAALTSMPSRVTSCSREPTRLAGMTNTGSSAIASSVSRQSNTSIAPSVIVSVSELGNLIPTGRPS